MPVATVVPPTPRVGLSVRTVTAEWALLWSGCTTDCRRVVVRACRGGLRWHRSSTTGVADGPRHAGATAPFVGLTGCHLTGQGVLHAATCGTHQLALPIDGNTRHPSPHRN